MSERRTGVSNGKITGPLPVSVLAGLAALSLAATCPHQASTKEREADWD